MKSIAFEKKLSKTKRHLNCSADYFRSAAFLHSHQNELLPNNAIKHIYSYHVIHIAPQTQTRTRTHTQTHIYAAKVYVAPAAWPLRNHKISNMSHKWWFDIFSIYALFCSPIAGQIANFKYPGWSRRHPHMMMMTEMCILPPTCGYFFLTFILS